MSANTLQLTGMQTSDVTQWFYGSSPYVPSTWTRAAARRVAGDERGHDLDFHRRSAGRAVDGGIHCGPDRPDLRLQLGLSRYGNYTDAVDVRYDNVVIRLL